MISINTELAGMYKIEAIKPDGSRRILADWFPNLILNAGLDRMGNSFDYLQWCQLGSGSTTPAPTQTTLVARTASSNTVQSSVSSNSGSSPYYARRTTTYRFAAGSATGVHAEVGVGWGSTGSLYSRALILDALGSPTTITVLSDESIDVTYELRMYVWTSSTAGTLTLRGITHATTMKSAIAASWSLVGSQLSAVAFPPGVPIQAYTGTVSADITGSPSGTFISSVYFSPESYVPGTYEAKINIFADLNDFNNALGVGAIRVSSGWGAWQIGFTPSILKTSDDVLELQLKHSWGRKP